ncbi:MAG: PAS domain-containing protein [Proteobacteria bacterium]|nr:PAS domain-containing protein [Pseudomonadota bacterium]MBI3498877.1 PAS domain-containing protein [Pseudomonadota bacterium]
MPAAPTITIADAKLQQLLDYWRSKRRGTALPRRDAIDPVEIPRLLPHLMLSEPIDGGADFRYRLVGTAVVEAAGMDFTGKSQNELLPPTPYRDYVQGLNRLVMRERRPLYAESSYRSHRLSDRWTFRLILPLATDGEAVGMMLAGQVFGARANLPAPPPVAESADFEAGAYLVLD